jgi:hypothetical protein
MIPFVWAGTRPASRFECQRSGRRVSHTPADRLRAAKKLSQSGWWSSVGSPVALNLRPGRAVSAVSPTKKPWPLTWTRSEPTLQSFIRQRAAYRNASTRGRSNCPCREKIRSAGGHGQQGLGHGGQIVVHCSLAILDGCNEERDGKYPIVSSENHACLYSRVP